MRRYLIVPLFFLLLLNGCRPDSATGPEIVSTKNGALLFKIDRENAPAGVQTVTAFLFRSGSDTLSATTNIVTDSSSFMTFFSVPIGEWQILVEARSASGSLMYSGTGTVLVIANQTVSLSIILQQVPGSTGTVILNISWGGSSNNAWVDYQSNPVLVSTNPAYEPGGVKQPVVLYDGQKYRMWYQALYYSAGAFVMYAESPDGITWEKKNNAMPVLFPGEAEWESGGVSPGAVIIENGVFKMFYNGQNSTKTKWCVGVATSTDGITWIRSAGNPVLEPASNEASLLAASVIKRGAITFLYFTPISGSLMKICLAISENGTTFQRYSGNPILTAAGGWEGSSIYEASVYFENDKFTMVYSNTIESASAFGMAVSMDGYNWTRSEGNPFFTNTMTANNWALGSIGYPCIVRTPTDLRIYYTGHTSSSTKDKIGLVKKNM